MFIQTCLHKLSNLIKTKSKTQMFIQMCLHKLSNLINYLNHVSICRISESSTYKLLFMIATPIELESVTHVNVAYYMTTFEIWVQKLVSL